MYHLKALNALKRMEHSKMYQQNKYANVWKVVYILSSLIVFSYLVLIPILFSYKIYFWNENNMNISNYK